VVGRLIADTADILHLRGVSIATIFGLLYTACKLVPPGKYD